MQNESLSQTLTTEFASRRSVVCATNGMVATSQPLAASAGLRMMLSGGNAIDAAIATAAVLNVVEPMSTGIGGDAFALVWIAREKKLYALNASGRAPAALTLEMAQKRGATREMPSLGWLPVTVPGAVDGWATLVERFGRKKLGETLEPAIDYAENGFPVSEIIAGSWRDMQSKCSMHPATAQAYLNRDQAPRMGEIHRQPDLAHSLRTIAEGGRDAFYLGELAEKIVADSKETGGFFTREDFANHTSTWDEPISTQYRGVTLYECPPNGQGVVALEALNILEGFDIGAMEHNGTEYLHTLIEATKLAFADALAHVADPRVVPVPVARMLSRAYATTRRELIDPMRANPNPRTGFGAGSDTVYLTVVDRERNAVSFINSLFDGFGSGMVVPGTGICLQNRGAGFSLDPANPNVLAPGKRPYHTIIPAMAFRNGAPWMSFGVMGGFMQPQGHLQVLCNTVDFGMDPQRALDAPRFRWFEGADVALEPEFDSDTRMGLAKRGHTILDADREEFGGGQIIMIDSASGVMLAGSDRRKDGGAVGW